MSVPNAKKILNDATSLIRAQKGCGFGSGEFTDSFKNCKSWIRVIKKLVRDYNGKKTEEANVILEDIEEAIYQYKFYEQRYKNEKKKKRLEVLEKAENKKDRFKKLFRENKIEKNQQNAASIAFFALAFGFLGLYFIV